MSQDDGIEAAEAHMPHDSATLLHRHDGIVDGPLAYQRAAIQARTMMFKEGTVDAPTDAAVDQVISDLLTSFEELRVADEELRQSNEALADARALTEAEQWRYRELFEFAPDGYLVTDQDGLIEEANWACGRLLNVPPQHLVGKPLAVYVAQEDRGAFRRGLPRLWIHGRASEWEIRLQPRHRPVLFAALTVAVSGDSGGRPRGLRWLVRDISERKRMEAALHALNADLEERVAQRTAELAAALEGEQQARAEAEGLAAERAAILEHIADGVVTAAPDGRVTYVNPAAKRLFGLPEDAPSAEASPDLPGRVLLANAARRGKRVARAELTIPRPDGAIATASANATPILAPDGTHLGAVLTLHDLTADRELERQKEEFLANISHDLRTPLTAIKAAVEIALTHATELPPDQLHRLCVNIDTAAERMMRLVSDLLDLTHLQAGQLRLDLQPCDLTDVARRAAAVIEPLARGRGQRLAIDVPADPVLARADAERLEQVLVNLLDNAQRHGRAGGAIRLVLTRLVDEVRIAIADDGPGIPRDEQPYLFGRFFRARQATGRTAGRGLGLAIARALMTLHDGRIWVESCPGQGATFWIALPINARADLPSRGMDP
jgi:PAS domain S-box-containing protein